MKFVIASYGIFLFSCPKNGTVLVSISRVTAVVTLGMYNKIKEYKRRSAYEQEWRNIP